MEGPHYEVVPPPRRKRGLSSEDARIVRQRGHNDAKEFALAIGLTDDYKNDPKAKKDVIDPSGEAHSVKSGEKKWQIFLYSEGRFESDVAFSVMNGMGQILLECIRAFPRTFAEYQADKVTAKERLRTHMVALKDRLQDKTRLKAFLNKSIFNGGEVLYLTVKDAGMFHVFYGPEVINVLADNLEVCNSRTIFIGSMPEQKVLFKYAGVNLGEIEMRNDSKVHYREIRFNMIKKIVMGLLYAKIKVTDKYSSRVLVHGEASKHFGRWKKARAVVSS